MSKYLVKMMTGTDDITGCKTGGKTGHLNKASTGEQPHLAHFYAVIIQIVKLLHESSEM